MEPALPSLIRATSTVLSPMKLRFTRKPALAMSATIASLVCWIAGSTIGGPSWNTMSTPLGKPASARSFLA